MLAKIRQETDFRIFNSPLKGANIAIKPNNANILLVHLFVSLTMYFLFNRIHVIIFLLPHVIKAYFNYIANKGNCKMLYIKT